MEVLQTSPLEIGLRPFLRVDHAYLTAWLWLQPTMSRERKEFPVDNRRSGRVIQESRGAAHVLDPQEALCGYERLRLSGDFQNRTGRQLDNIVGKESLSRSSGQSGNPILQQRAAIACSIEAAARGSKIFEMTATKFCSGCGAGQETEFQATRAAGHPENRLAGFHTNKLTSLTLEFFLGHADREQVESSSFNNPDHTGDMNRERTARRRF